MAMEGRYTGMTYGECVGIGNMEKARKKIGQK